MTKPVANWKRFCRFSLVGLFGAGLQMALLWTLTRCFRLPILAATPAAVEIVVLHNFVWHAKFTWVDRPFRTTREGATALLRFHAGNACISIAGNTILTYFLVQRANIPILPSAALAIAACSVLNFLLADRWVYSSAVCPRRQA